MLLITICLVINLFFIDDHEAIGSVQTSLRDTHTHILRKPIPTCDFTSRGRLKRGSLTFSYIRSLRVQNFEFNIFEFSEK